jgi:hypothetical protein
MAFVDIPTLNGGTAHVAAGSVYRVTRGIGDAAGLTRVEFGNEHQLTRPGIREIAQVLTGAGAKLAEFAAPDGTPIFPSVPAISSVRDADPHTDPPGANAVIIVSGQRQSVHQTVQEVRQILQ